MTIIVLVHFTPFYKKHADACKRQSLKIQNMHQYFSKGHDVTLTQADLISTKLALQKPTKLIHFTPSYPIFSKKHLLCHLYISSACFKFHFLESPCLGNLLRPKYQNSTVKVEANWSFEDPDLNSQPTSISKRGIFPQVSYLGLS